MIQYKTCNRIISYDTPCLLCTVQMPCEIVFTVRLVQERDVSIPSRGVPCLFRPVKSRPVKSCGISTPSRGLPCFLRPVKVRPVKSRGISILPRGLPCFLRPVKSRPVKSRGLNPVPCNPVRSQSCPNFPVHSRDGSIPSCIVPCSKYSFLSRPAVPGNPEESRSRGIPSRDKRLVPREALINTCCTRYENRSLLTYLGGNSEW